MKRIICIILLLLLCACSGSPSGGRAYVPLETAVTEEQITAHGEPDGQRRAVAEAALSLVGKVGYFWGGKCKSVEPDPAWGELRLVESEGSETTGTMQPWGLDCSGYTAWCFMRLFADWEETAETFGAGTKKQFYNSYAIDWDELQVGDLIFQHNPLEGKGNHVGVVVGFDADDEPLIAHCSYSLGGVVVTGRGTVFVYPRRPNCLS